MNIMTVEQLYTIMEQAYFDSTGYPVDSASDVGLRFRIVAGELYSLAQQERFILKQAFPQTAQGEYLDRHAAARGLYRKQASTAIGRLCFYIDEPVERDIEIPVGTVCACRDKPYLRYATVSSGVIPAGSTLGEVSARSLGQGNVYNAAAGRINMMVTPPVGVTKVRNLRVFRGGCETEDDRMLRDRLLEFIRLRPNGFDRETYISRLLELDEVLDANVYRQNDGGLAVTVRTRSKVLDTSLQDEIKSLLTECLLTPAGLTMAAAKEKQLSLSVVVMPANGCADDAAVTDVKTLLAQECAVLRIGETFYPERLGQKISRLETVGDFVIENGTAPMQAGPDEYFAITAEVLADAW